MAQRITDTAYTYIAGNPVEFGVTTTTGGWYVTNTGELTTGKYVLKIGEGFMNDELNSDAKEAWEEYFNRKKLCRSKK